ncbi:probable serine/threonine-protein kinase Rtk1p [Trichomonascus vanleenenianus]|uniref:putative serine/threonine protein kinase RTK1 n=1 Tax=Trichomonascus vanleenenianus TaxID=2268995 RepID=UPI003ECA5376
MSEPNAADEEFDFSDKKMAEVTSKLANSNIGQTRFLGDSTHHYEQYSLPASRQPSAEYFDRPPSGNASGETTPKSISPNKSRSSRPSAAFLSAANDKNEQSSPSSQESSPGNSRVSSKNNMFYLPQTHDSSTNSPVSLSRNSSPTTASPFPTADQDDPYARRFRPPPVQNVHEIEPRFVFKKIGGSKSSTSLKSFMDHHKHEKKASKLILSKALNSKGSGSDSEDSSLKKSSHSGSMIELKRFFKKGLKKDKDNNHKRSSRSRESSRSRLSSSHSRQSSQDNNMPFSESGFRKYGKIGRVLGSGAGGSVRLMKRASDNTVFAVKEFRERHPNESQRDYSKKVTAEFCIGSTLHHANIVETLDIIQENGRYYEVMEYCPYDFFAIVMSGKMTANEIGCCFKQIISGVKYLHEMGLAHRDLKLDNCVVSAQGVLKLIDFGSAVVFQYPFEQDIVMAKGVVGSDPYLAPEVLSEPRYDPRCVDIWSIAIIFCCMTLRRFPWKAPKISDNSFRLFASSPGEEPIIRPIKSNDSQPHTQIKGPWRLLRLLPRESREIIGQMLDLNFNKRAHMEEIVADDWVQSLQMCTLDSTGKFIPSTDHEHTLVPSEVASLEPRK